MMSMIWNGRESISLIDVMNLKKLIKRALKVCPILVILFITWYISNNYYQLFLIQGNSMQPAYHNMQLVVLDKKTSDYKQGDVIAFNCDKLEDVLVKRIAAGPGDVAVIIDGTLYVNGEVSAIYPEQGYFEEAGILEKTIHLNSGEYIVIGDNVQESKDSRYEEVGVVNREKIMGRIR